MRLVYDRVELQIPGAFSFAGAGAERIGVTVNLISKLELRALAGQSQVELRDATGEPLSLGGKQLLLRAITRVFDYLGVSHVGCHVRGKLAWPVTYGASAETLLATAGTLLAVGLAEKNPLTSAEIIELAVQSGGVPELVVPLVTGGAALVWTKESARGVRFLQLPAENLDLAGMILVPKTPSRTSLQQLSYCVDNLGLLTALLLGAAGQPTLEQLKVATAGESLERQGGNRVLGQLVDYLRGLDFPAAISGSGDCVVVFASLWEETVQQAQAAAWQVISVSFLSQGGQTQASCI